ncbi:uncharacterized protein N7506_009797, partial [Penicillium brevicompactum]|uniref:uncharacterized protein n=1 Tax=Penicillium brevicompactum TaxID=5074 RepID=UPI002541BC99
SQSAIYIVSIYGKSALAFALLSELLAARSVENTFSHRGVDCSSSTLPGIGDTWETFADSWGMAAGDLKPLNPDLDCPNFDEETEYCVSGEAKDDEPTKTISDRELTQPGLSDDCDKFHKVVDGDSCGAIEASAGITHSQLSKWKTYINDSIFSPSSISGSISFSHANSQCSECSNIWLDFYIPNLTLDSKKYHRVVDGESCPAIQKEADGISLAQFREWYSNVDAKCGNLWNGYYVCSGV